MCNTIKLDPTARLRRHTNARARATSLVFAAVAVAAAAVALNAPIFFVKSKHAAASVDRHHDRRCRRHCSARLLKDQIEARAAASSASSRFAARLSGARVLSICSQFELRDHTSEQVSDRTLVCSTNCSAISRDASARRRQSLPQSRSSSSRSRTQPALAGAKR